MLYLVSATLVNREPLAKAHGEFVEFLRAHVAPSLDALERFRQAGQLLAGGVVAGSPDLVFILKLDNIDSHLAVRQLLFELPIFTFYQWEVRPLESFAEWGGLMRG